MSIPTTDRLEGDGRAGAGDDAAAAAVVIPPRVNEFMQPVGAPVPDWPGAQMPARVTLEGRYARLEPVEAERHAHDLYEAYRCAPDGRDWTYMAYGPFETFDAYRAHLVRAASLDDPLHFAVVDRESGAALGTLALMRIDCANGVIEVGHVAYSPRLQRTRVATEAIYLLMRYVFDELHNRRFEWKCDALNAPSRRAALRFGFTFEGVFRQAVVYKGRSRDTAWFSIVDGEWPAIRQGYEHWLRAENFATDGSQSERLAIGAK
jgi:RimJ/RimL family protein N-acetyltransferase